MVVHVNHNSVTISTLMTTIIPMKIWVKWNESILKPKKFEVLLNWSLILIFSTGRATQTGQKVLN